ncbi:MAG TPA: hypothetical protein VGR54_09165 [Nitrosopumilaceae archaeon]|nr:hypothetical protein [Nitrosopumilaceae archaeon]
MAKLIEITVLAVLLFSLVGQGAFAEPNHDLSNSNENRGGKQATHDNTNTENNCQENTDNQNTDSAPSGSVLVLNIKHHVTNDEDSGFYGYWALDNYEKHIKIWQTSLGNFYVVTNYEGTWQTFAGALSPGAGVAESKDASGCFEGGYVATFSGTFTPGDHSTHGDIGTFDYGGTKADILKGSGQIGNPPHFSYLDTYFSSTSNFNYINWGWDYHFDSQLWHNFSTGSYGDIIV